MTTHRIAVILGDGIGTDIAAARAVGARSVLMLTGVTTRAEVDALPADERPTAVAADAAELAAASAPAIQAAAEIGLYRETPEGRRGVASLLAALVRQAGGEVPAELEQQIVLGQQQRRLRFL